MGESPKMTLWSWVVIVVGIVLLAGGLFMLGLPVYLDGYDRYGIRVECGNGYTSQLLHATVDDLDQPAANHVGQCKNALAHHRAWLIPIAGIGALILVGKAVAWRLGRATGSDSEATGTWTEAPDDFMHEAAVLDHRQRPRRDRPSGTTM